MVTTVTDNSPQAINTSLFSLEKDTDGKVLLLNNKIKEANDAIAAINKILDGINKDAGVVSVNGKQGIVTLDASDVGALPDTTTIPSKTSQLTNDSGFITSSSLSSYVPTSRTVNNKALSNNISLTASDVGALPSDTHIPTDPVQSSWTETDTSSLAYIENKPNLATVATSGSYNDLSNKPTIPAAQVNSDWNATSGVARILNKPSLATVATSGSYNDLSNKPTIPIATSQLSNDSDFATNAAITNAINANNTNFKSFNKQYYTLDLTNLDINTFYPVTFESTDIEHDCEIHSPSLGGGDPYNQNRIHFLLTTQGWSDTGSSYTEISYNKYEVTEVTIGSIVGGITIGSTAVFLRGGMVYKMISNLSPTLRTTTVTMYGSETYAPGPNFYGGANTNVSVIKMANTTSNTFG